MCVCVCVVTASDGTVGAAVDSGLTGVLCMCARQGFMLPIQTRVLMEAPHYLHRL